MDLKYKICDPQSSNFGPLANTVNHLRVWSSTWPRLAWPIKKCKSLLRQCRQYYNDPWPLPATISPIISCDPNSHSRGKRLGNVWPLGRFKGGKLFRFWYTGVAPLARCEITGVISGALCHVTHTPHLSIERANLTGSKSSFLLSRSAMLEMLHSPRDQQHLGSFPISIHKAHGNWLVVLLNTWQFCTPFALSGSYIKLSKDIQRSLSKAFLLACS